MQILFLAQTGALGEGILSVDHPLFLGYYALSGGKGVSWRSMEIPKRFQRDFKLARELKRELKREH